MTTTLPMFPLQMVVYPGELLPLHIFEERYQQLIHDCEIKGITFGIPAYINNTMTYGTEVALERVAKRYNTGASDIVCRGLRVFQMLRFDDPLSNNLYAGAEVRFLKNIKDGTISQQKRFLLLVQELYDVLHVEYPDIANDDVHSFSFAHKLGLSLDQEATLVQMASESDRYAYLIDHLSVTIPIAKQINRTKELIQLNGHFKNFDPLDFSEYKLTDI
ncbi:MAG: LON peptidase substrate-binding domain-containing protein [Leeuwenhoekiella sp.]